MFDSQGALAGKLEAFAQAVSGGAEPGAAFREAFGPPESLELPFRVYFERRAFQVTRANLDLAVRRDRMEVRRLAPAESTAARALFHVNTGRAVEARAALTEARAQDPKEPGSYEAEALLLDQDDKPDEAKAAWTRAVESGSTSPYAHYRLASLTWRRDADPEALKAIERLLANAIGLNPRYADAYSWLGEVRAVLGVGEPAGLVMRAVSLEPREPLHRLRAAAALMRLRRFDEAAVQAQAAQTLAATENERQRAKQLLDAIAKAKASGG